MQGLNLRCFLTLRYFGWAYLLPCWGAITCPAAAGLPDSTLAGANLATTAIPALYDINLAGSPRAPLNLQHLERLGATIPTLPKALRFWASHTPAAQSCLPLKRHKRVPQHCNNTQVHHLRPHERCHMAHVHHAWRPLLFAWGCTPSQRSVRSPAQRLAARVDYFFTFKHHNCKLNTVYSAIGAGDVVESDRYGKVIVKDVLVRKRTIKELRYRTPKAKRRKLTTLHTKGIKRLVVSVNVGDRYVVSGNGLYTTQQLNANFRTKTVKLSKEESKQALLRFIARRGSEQLLGHMFPEERKNASSLMAKYSTGIATK